MQKNISVGCFLEIFKFTRPMAPQPSEALLLLARIALHGQQGICGLE